MMEEEIETLKNRIENVEKKIENVENDIQDVKGDIKNTKKEIENASDEDEKILLQQKAMLQQEENLLLGLQVGLQNEKNSLRDDLKELQHSLRDNKELLLQKHELRDMIGTPQQKHRFVTGPSELRAPSDTVASRGTGLIGISAVPTFYFDPTEDQRIKKALIPDPTAQETDDTTFPSGKYRLSLAKVEKKAKTEVDFTVQKDFGNMLKASYSTFVSVQGDRLQPLPASIASRDSLTKLDGWFHCTVKGMNFVVGDIEFKSSYYSTTEGLPQALTYATSIALNLINVGVEPKDVIVPVMVSNGHLVQFACMFCEHHLPLALTISSVIDTLDINGKRLAHAYMMKIESHVQKLKVKLEQLDKLKTDHRLEDLDVVANPKDWSSALMIPESVYIKKGYVTSGWYEDDLDASCRHVFETLSKLWSTPAWEFVCPPVGLSTSTFESKSNVAEKSYGALLFMDLTQHNFKSNPPPFEHATAYADALETACKAFHKAGVVHGDLYPSNIFWKMNDKSDDKSLEMRIIDWDTAFAAKDALPDHIQKMWDLTYKWKAYKKNANNKIFLLDTFMVKAFRYASERESVWENISGKDDSNSNDGFRTIQRLYTEHSKVPANG